MTRHLDGRILALWALLAGSSVCGAGEGPRPKVCVLDFQDAMEAETGGRELKWISKALADLLIDDLSVRCTVVVRERTQTLLKEQTAHNFAAAEDQGGRFAGALKVRYATGGTYRCEGDNVLKIWAWCWDVESGRSLRVNEKQGPLTDLLRLERELAVELLRDLSLPVESEEATALLRVPKASIDAVRAYGLGLDAYDRGDLPGAVAWFRLAANQERPLIKAGYWCGKAQIESNDPTLAALDLQQVVTSHGADPWTADAGLLLADVLRRSLKRPDLALMEYERVAATFPDEAQGALARIEAGRLYMAAGNPRAAWRAFDRSLGFISSGIPPRDAPRIPRRSVDWTTVLSESPEAYKAMFLSLSTALGEGDKGYPVGPWVHILGGGEWYPDRRGIYQIDPANPRLVLPAQGRGPDFYTYVLAPSGSAFTSVTCRLTGQSRDETGRFRLQISGPALDVGDCLHYMMTNTIVRATLVDHVTIPSRNILRITTEADNADIRRVELDFGLTDFVVIKPTLPSASSQVQSPPPYWRLPKVSWKRDAPERMPWGTSPGGPLATDISLVCDSKGTYHMIIDGHMPGEDRGGFWLSSGDGKTWSAPRRLLLTSVSGDGQPCLIQRMSGEFMLVWASDRRMANGNNIWMSRSLDLKQWSPPQMLALGNAAVGSAAKGSSQSGPVLMEDSDEDLHLFYADSGSGILGARSRDGVKWESPNPAVEAWATAKCRLVRPTSCAAVPDGTIALCVDGVQGGILVSLISPDGRCRSVLADIPGRIDAAFFASDRPANWSVLYPTTPFRPRIAVDGKGIFWLLYGRLNAGLMVSCSTDATHWDANGIRLGAAPYEWGPTSVVIAADGRPALTWTCVQGDTARFGCLPQDVCEEAVSRAQKKTTGRWYPSAETTILIEQ